MKNPAWPILTSDDLQWPPVTFQVKIKDSQLYFELIGGYIPKIAFLCVFFKILDDKNLNLANFLSKMVWKVGRGSLENDRMQFFSIRVLFCTLKEASVKWGKNRSI